MHYYKVTAEHMSHTKVGLAADEMESIPDLILMSAGMDPVFERQGVWVVACEHKLENQLQDIVWKYNGGAWCEQTEIDEEYADAMC
jgi:hypothetical protein